MFVCVLQAARGSSGYAEPGPAAEGGAGRGGHGGASGSAVLPAAETEGRTPPEDPP